MIYTYKENILIYLQKTALMNSLVPGVQNLVFTESLEYFIFSKNLPVYCTKDFASILETASVNGLLKNVLAKAIIDTEEALQKRLTEVSGFFLLKDQSLRAEEAYSLQIDSKNCILAARETAGILYGLSSLDRLMSTSSYTFMDFQEMDALALPGFRLEDWPEYEHRGLMIDLARHFIPLPSLYKLIDLLSRYKMNRLHLHISDDQGFRLQIDSFPEFNKRASFSSVDGDSGGYYSKDEIKALVTYGLQRNIQIIPEIDLPGHCNALQAAIAELNDDNQLKDNYTGIEVGFSYLNPDNPKVWEVLDRLFDELLPCFPGPWFHFGGDEVMKLSKDQYIRFIEKANRLVTSKGKIPIAWAEASLADLTPETLVQHWEHVHEHLALEAGKKGHKIILSPGNKAYLDMKYDENSPIGLSWAGFTSVESACSWDPKTLLEGLDPSLIQGIEAALWTETVRKEKDLFWLLLPRLAGIAQLAWKGNAEAWMLLREKLQKETEFWKAQGYFYNDAF